MGKMTPLPVVVFFVILTAGSQTEASGLSEECKPRAPDGCLERNLNDCVTCCCTGENVDYFDEDIPEQNCSAPPAIYEITFVYTLSNECHPNFTAGKWSRPFAGSHSGAYRLWDACMNNVSLGVANFSQTGDSGGIITEATPVAILHQTVLDIPVFDGEEVKGSGNTSIYLTLDKERQYVSTLTRLESSPDWVVGVADLRLCNGSKWKQRVKVCFELFSTATASKRAFMRNSVQYRNCSFGYVEFNLNKIEEFKERTELEEICYPKVPEQCPKDKITECDTCCCKSSDNVDFFDPDEKEPECTADPTTYEMKFTFTWNPTCHPNNYKSYSVFSPVWSWPVSVSHNTKYRLWDACMDNVSVGVGLISQIGLPFIITQEFTAAGANVLDYSIGNSLLPPDTQFSLRLKVDRSHQWVSALSNRGPTPDHLVGVADLQLCDGDKWKQRVKVCFELFSTGAASERVGDKMTRNSVQYNNCSFGFIELIQIKPVGNSCGKVGPLATTFLLPLLLLELLY